MKGGAVYDATGVYRYWLERWELTGKGERRVNFLMLNPSTAGRKAAHVLQAASYPVPSDFIDDNWVALPAVFAAAAEWFGCDLACTWIDGTTFVLDDLVVLGGYLVPRLTP